MLAFLRQWVYNEAMKGGGNMKKLSQIIVTSIQDIMTVPSHTGRYLQIKNRHSYGLSFCQSGQIDYVQNGNRISSIPTRAVLLPMSGNYELFGMETGMFPLINFECAETFLDTVTGIDLTNPESYRKDFERIQELWIYPENHARIMSILYDILQRLSREETEASPFLAPAVRYLNEHIFDCDLTNSVLAAKSNISEVYFRRLFLRAYGMTPKQYILQLRLRQAHRLLIGNRQTVSSVAESCGFSSVYHFSRAFKEATGLTPTEYAKSTELY